ncbi:MAG: class II glutamine amidotransferase, partial [Dehalococcoidia bacterium]|nr:class II glutamine amidotransferase [Dehalococcoidia bacterium]
MKKTSGPLQPWAASDRPREECGVVGVYSPGRDAGRVAFFGLFALQHRGQESAGIAASDGSSIRIHTDMGLVTQVFREEELRPLQGSMAIGHTRYSTTGSSQECNAQPFLVEGVHGQLALGHNGNVVNAAELQTQLRDEWDCTFSSSTDSEVMAYLLVNAAGQTWEERAAYFMRNVQGAYSVVV